MLLVQKKNGKLDYRSESFVARFMIRLWSSQTSVRVFILINFVVPWSSGLKAFIKLSQKIEMLNAVTKIRSFATYVEGWSLHCRSIVTAAQQAC